MSILSYVFFEIFTGSLTFMSSVLYSINLLMWPYRFWLVNMLSFEKEIYLSVFRVSFIVMCQFPWIPWVNRHIYDHRTNKNSWPNWDDSFWHLFYATKLFISYFIHLIPFSSCSKWFLLRIQSLGMCMIDGFGPVSSLTENHMAVSNSYWWLETM